MQGQAVNEQGQVRLRSGGQPTIWIAPANGFPPEVYQPFATAVTVGCEVIGYRPPPLRDAALAEFPTWQQLADDLLEQLPAGQPVIGIGHSLGAVLTLYAARQAPERFAGIVLIDPVIFGRRLRWIIDVLQRFGRGTRIPRARSAQRRRDRFASPEEAHDRWRTRQVFAEFDEAALRAYVASGLTAVGADDWRLSWPRDWEAHIFATSPTDAWARLAVLRLPTLIIRGRHSDLIDARLWQRLQRHAPQIDYREVAAGHLLPMEVPHEVAYHVDQWLQHHNITVTAGAAV
jgi:pimeloyl-ACP methyl ester carboxylesterase